MAAQKEDRRIRRTKRLLRQALAELMNEKDFKDITVKEITDHADLNRGTFYFHYSDTYDLREKIEDELIADFRVLISSYNPTEENHSARPMIEKTLSYIREQRFLITTLFQKSQGDSMQSKFSRVIEDTILGVQQRFLPMGNPAEQSFRCRFIASGLMGCINMWLSAGYEMTDKEFIDTMDAMICQIFPVI